jgi:hypothetical protein
MSFSWKNEAEKEGPQNAPRLVPGSQRLKIVKIVFGKKGKDGQTELFKSDKGDPQIMCIYGDAHGREGAEMYTLSEAAGWKLAKVLAAAGANVEKMDAAGITPASFAEERFANANLVGRELTAEVSYTKKGDKEYMNLAPAMPQPGNAATPGRSPAMAGAPASTGFNPEQNIDDSDIPF